MVLEFAKSWGYTFTLRGEAADRVDEFYRLCKGRGIDPAQRISDLVLGDILIAEKIQAG